MIKITTTVDINGAQFAKGFIIYDEVPPCEQSELLSKLFNGLAGDISELLKKEEKK